MKAWEIGDQTGLDSLRMVERDAPIASHGQAVVAIKACALNHRDLMIVRNQYGGPKPDTQIPLSDAAGEVISIGEGVTNVKPGDQVGAVHFTGWVDGDFDPSYFGMIWAIRPMVSWLNGLLFLHPAFSNFRAN